MHKVLGAMARRYARTAPEASAADFVADLLIARPVLQSMSDRKLAQLANALRTESYFATRLVARLPPDKAGQIAVDRFVRFNATSVLDDVAIARLADVLTADPRFLDVSLDKAAKEKRIPKQRARELALGHFGLDGSVADLEDDILRGFAEQLIRDPRFLAAGLDAAAAGDLIPKERAIAIAFDRFATRKEAGELEEKDLRVLAEALVSDHRFLEASLEIARAGDLLPRDKAVAIALDAFATRREAAGLDDAGQRGLAEALVSDAKFLDVVLETDLIPKERALEMALDRLVTRRGVADLDVMSVRALADGLMSDPAFLEAGLDSAVKSDLIPKDRAIAIAMDRLVSRGEAAGLDEASIKALAVALTKEPRFLSASIETAFAGGALAPRRAIRLAVEQLTKAGKQLDEASIRALADALVTDPRFMDVILDFALRRDLIPARRAIGMALDRFVSRRGLSGLDGGAIRALAEALVAEPEFLDASLDAANEKDLVSRQRALGIVLDRLVRRGDVANLDDASVGSLAEALVVDSRFVAAALDKATSEELIPTDRIVGMALARLSRPDVKETVDDASLQSFADILCADQRFIAAGLDRVLAGPIPESHASRIAFVQLAQNGGAASLDDASIRALADALHSDPRFAEASFEILKPRTPLPPALQPEPAPKPEPKEAPKTVLDRLAASGEISSLDDESVRDLAATLSMDQRFLATAFGIAIDRGPVSSAHLGRLADAVVADSGAFKNVLDLAEHNRAFEGVATEQGLRIAQTFISRPGFADSLLDDLSFREVSPVVIRQAASRKLSFHLAPEQVVSLAYALATPEFATAALDALRPGDAAELIFDALGRRKLLERLSIGQAEAFAASIAALPFVPETMVRKLDTARLNELLFSQMAGQSIEMLTDDQRRRLSETLMHKSGAAEAFLASLPRERLLQYFAKDFDLHPPLAQVSVGAAKDFVRSVVSDVGFSSALTSTADILPTVRVREMAYALSSKHQPLVEEQLREATPDVMWRNESYAQEGEDLILARVFAERQNGFYVDVGALHPIRFSNTYLFYRRGWRGINIDATPGSMEAFDELRPQDVNIETLVSSDRSPHTYYMLNEPALNTMSEELANQRAKENPNYRIVGTRKLVSRPLSEILDQHAPAGQQIDFLTIDVEGADLEVLRSNDWERYRPEFVLAELLTTELDGLANHEISRYLAEQGYRPYAKQFNTVFFARQDAAGKASAPVAARRRATQTGKAGEEAVDGEKPGKRSAAVRKRPARRKPPAGKRTAAQ